MATENDPAVENADLSPKTIIWIKWILYFVAWAAVAIYTACNHPEDLKAAFAFPVGFLGLLPPISSVLGTWLGAWPAILFGWMLYSAFAVAMIKANRLWIYVLLYSLFCVLLAFNLSGCRKLIETAAGIH